MDFAKAKERAQELPRKAAEALGALAAGAVKFCARLTDTIRHRAGKRGPLVFALGGVMALFLVLLLIALALNSRKPEKGAAVNVAAGPNIPPEELFIPAEPDFVPEYILEKEPRRSWSPEDVRSYWKNPQDPDFWRKEINSAAEELLKGVP